MRLISRLALAVLLLTSASPAGVRFYKGTYNEALRAAANEKKLVLVDFMTDWCMWCDTLDARTYSDSTVAAYVHRHFIPFKIDAEKGDGIPLAKKHGVRAFPTILVVSAEGDEVDRIIGYAPPDKFLQSLDDICAGKNTIGAVKALLQERPTDPEAHYAAAQKYIARFDFPNAEEQFRKVLELDPENTRGHADDARFETAMLSLQTSGKPDQLIAFAEAHPSAKEYSQALRLLTRYYLRQKDPGNAQTWFRRFLEKEPSDAQEMNNFAWECAGLKANLGYAAEIAAKAVSLATGDEERAMFLDTQATVEFERGNPGAAVVLEQKALGLLGGASDEVRKPYEETLAKFKAGNAAPSAR